MRPVQYKGRTPGATDRTPRRTPPDPRIPEIAAALAAAQTGDGPAVTPGLPQLAAASELRILRTFSFRPWSAPWARSRATMVAGR